jgi:prepilin-type N-terminal cleavage/methylation domain-containing protein
MLSSNPICQGVFSINQAVLLHLKNRQLYVFGKGKGFTLIELLVVLVIIGVLTSLIGLSIAPNKPSPQKESRRFYQVLEAARQQAVLFNQDLGVELTGNSYRFYTGVHNNGGLRITPCFLSTDCLKTLIKPCGSMGWRMRTSRVTATLRNHKSCYLPPARLLHSDGL